MKNFYIDKQTTDVTYDRVVQQEIVPRANIKTDGFSYAD